MTRPQEQLLSLVRLIVSAFIVLALIITAQADCQIAETTCDYITTPLEDCSLSRSETEAYVEREIVRGRPVDLRSFKDKSLRGCFISALLLDARLRIPPQGVIIVGATINGLVDLQNAEITHHTELRECQFNGAVNLRRSHFK